MAIEPTQPTNPAPPAPAPGSVKKQARDVQTEPKPTMLPWSPLALLVPIAIMGWLFTEFTSVKFDSQAITAEGIAGLIGALFVISAFIERFLEVFVTAWRALGSEEINHEIELAQAIIDDPNATAAERQAAEETKAHNLEAKWRHTFRTRCWSFQAAVLLGAAVALLGVRALQPLVDLNGVTGWQLDLFRTFDVVLTAGLIGGGTDGLHKLFSAITTFLDETKKKTKGQGTK